MIDQTTQMKNQIKETFFCINPHCKNLFNRVFQQNSSHCGLQDCAKWIGKIDSLSDMPNIKNKIKNDSQYVNKKFRMYQNQLGSISIDIKQNPLQIIILQEQIQTSVINSFKKSMQQLRQKVQQSLKLIESTLQMTIEDYFNPIASLKNQLKEFVKQYQIGNFKKGVQSLKINQIVSSQNFIEFLKLQNLVFFPQIKQHEQKIKYLISSLPNYLICTKQSLTSDIALSYQQKRNLAKYLKDPNDQHNKKLFKIASLIKVDQRNIYQKRNKSQNTTQYIIKCLICSSNFVTEKKKQVMSMWNNIFSQHLLQVHQKQIGYNFKHLISLTGCGKISVQEIIYKMTKYSYEGVQFIYKSGRKYYNFHYSNRQKLSIDIGCKGQTRLPLAYIQIIQPHEYFSIIATVAYVLKHYPDPIVQKKIVYIYTVIIADFAYIRRIIELFGADNIKIVDDKRTEESTIFYQDQQNTEVEQEQNTNKISNRQE